jgi:hypothetical protein
MSSETLRGREHLGGTDMNFKYVMRLWSGFIWLRIGPTLALVNTVVNVRVKKGHENL